MRAKALIAAALLAGMNFGTVAALPLENRPQAVLPPRVRYGKRRASQGIFGNGRPVATFAHLPAGQRRKLRTRWLEEYRATGMSWEKWRDIYMEVEA